MAPLYRHQLARISEAGWLAVTKGGGDGAAADGLAHWAARRLPLVVTRQAGLRVTDSVSLGLALPGRWGWRRIACSVARSDVACVDEFPRAEQALDLLATAVRPAWRGLCASLQAQGADAHVYGSYGWQLLSGLDHLRQGSDIDLWVGVTDAQHADAAAACLQRFSNDVLRLDGELIFGDGAAVAWREWLAWRAGSVKGLLVKSIDSCWLEYWPAWQSGAPVLQQA